MDNSSEMASMRRTASDRDVIVGPAWKGRERYGENRRTVNVGSAAQAEVFSMPFDARISVPREAYASPHFAPRAKRVTFCQVNGD
jgi:hypothetical protein